MAEQPKPSRGDRSGEVPAHVPTPVPDTDVRNGGGLSPRFLVIVALAVVAAAAVVAWQAVANPDFAFFQSDRSLVDRSMAWYLDRQPDRLAPPGDDSAPVPFVIVEGQTVAEVATALETQGLVVDADAFRMLARVTGQDVGMQAGSHTLRRDMSAREVLAALQTGYEAGTVVTVPEGLRLEEVAGILEAAGVVDAQAFVALATDPLSHRDGLAAQRPVDADLEGYLFPDTYEFAVGATADAVLARFVEQFDTRFDAERRAQAEGSGLTIHEIVTLASIVEREAMVPAERPQIARVFLNRLDGDTRLLDADPTVQYALGYQPDISSWWKRPLTSEDLELDSPYNTYRVPGLPPGPIASPGLASLDAVLQPADGDWHYFVADGDACDGTHRFAATYEAHLQNVAAYRASGCGQ